MTFMWNLKKNKADFIEIENRIVVARGRGRGKWGGIGQRVQTL